MEDFSTEGIKTTETGEFDEEYYRMQNFNNEEIEDKRKSYELLKKDGKINQILDDTDDDLVEIDADKASNKAIQEAKGLKFVVNGYLSYAEEAILRRNVPSLYDGLKPVQRFLIYTSKLNKFDKESTKTNLIVSQALPYHPHGDAAVYEALCRMVDSNGVFSVPYYIGHGNLGRSYDNDGPAAMRYTYATLSPFTTNEFFSAESGVQKVYTEDRDHQYYRHLPVSFPNLLVSQSSGAAVGVATNIPSFNPKDVANAVLQYTKDGKVTDILVPDFATGGEIVQNTKSFLNVNITGRGKIKIRAKIEVEGKIIRVRELPPAVTVQKVDKEIQTKKEADDGSFKHIVSYDNLTDYKSNLNYEIVVDKEANVKSTILELFNKTSLQYNFSSHLFFVDTDENGKDFLGSGGVQKVIERWVAWRRRVLNKQAQVNVSSLAHDMIRYQIFVDLLNNREDVDKILDLLLNNKRGEAEQFIADKYEAQPDTISFILSRAISRFNRSGQYIDQLKQMKSDYDYWKTIEENPDIQIEADMKRLLADPYFAKERRTPISKVDYHFVEAEEKVDDEKCWFEVKDGFIAKYNHIVPETPGAFVIEAKANDVIVCIDSEAHVLKIYGEELPYSLIGTRGTYIPDYCGYETELGIMWATVADGRKYNIVYRDGYLSYFDTEPYKRENINQRSRVQAIGVNAATDQMVDIIPYSPDLYLGMWQRFSRSDRIGFVKIGDVKKRAAKARTKVMNATDFDNWGAFTSDQLAAFNFPLGKYLLDSKDKKMKKYNGFVLRPEGFEPRGEDDND